MGAVWSLHLRLAANASIFCRHHLRFVASQRSVYSIIQTTPSILVDWIWIGFDLAHFALLSLPTLLHPNLSPHRIESFHHHQSTCDMIVANVVSQVVFSYVAVVVVVASHA